MERTRTEAIVMSITQPCTNSLTPWHADLKIRGLEGWMTLGRRILVTYEGRYEGTFYTNAYDMHYM